jgi:glycosyltransferase involved in cell wall biosynthesis
LENKDPFFSVIMPTFNRADFLAKTIQSVLDQQYANFELIIVDDGSTDRTTEVVRSFQDEKIVYLKKHNGERAAARNAGIEKARGDYITFLDSDDVLRKIHLSTAVIHIRKEHPDVFHLGYDVVNETGMILYPWQKLPSPVNDKLVEGNFLSCLGVFVKREILLQHKFTEDRMLSGSEDYELWMRLAARFPFITFPEATAALVQHAARSVLQPDSSTLLRRIELLRKYLMEDAVFVKRYIHQLHRWNAFLNVYLGLHLALLPASKERAFRAAREAVAQYPAIVLQKRFWVVIQKIAFRRYR